MQALFDQIFQFYEQNSLFCMVAGGVVLLFLLSKPAKLLKRIMFLVVLALILYLAIALVASIDFGSNIKKGGLEKREKAVEGL